jgi:hypothetical protein
MHAGAGVHTSWKFATPWCHVARDRESLFPERGLVEEQQIARFGGDQKSIACECSAFHAALIEGRKEGPHNQGSRRRPVDGKNIRAILRHDAEGTVISGDGGARHSRVYF